MTDLKDFNLADLRAFLASREAEEALAAEPTPGQKFCAELVDHRISGPALADVFGRILTALDKLGVDVFAEDGAELRQDDGPVLATVDPDGPVLADPSTPVEPASPADPPARKGGKS